MEFGPLHGGKLGIRDWIIPAPARWIRRRADAPCGVCGTEFYASINKLLRCSNASGGGEKEELCFYDEQQPKLATATAVLYSGAASCVQHTYCTKVYVLISLNKKRSLLACEYACDGQRWYARRVLYQDSRRVIAGTLGVSWYARRVLYQDRGA